MQTIRYFLVLALIVLCAGISSARAADGFSDAQKNEVGEIVKTYLKNNPQVVFEALQNYQQKQQEDTQKQAEESIKKNIDALTAKDLPSAGNPDGDVTVVEFFDYNCGYCKKAVDDVLKVLDTDKNVRFVFREFPILGPTSETAARWSLAAHKQGKYFEFHKAIFHHQGTIDDASLEKAATDAGLDVAQAKKDIQSDEIKKAISDSRELAVGMQIHGTPAFIIGGKLSPGYLGQDGLQKAIDDTRKAKQ